MQRLDGSVALVTGAGRGIGAAVAERLAGDGAAVALNDWGQASGARYHAERIIAEGGQAAAFTADVSRRDMVRQMVDAVVQRWSRLDILVNNAGIAEFHEFLDVTTETWERHHDANLKGTFHCSQEVARTLVRQGEGGRIVSVASTGSQVGPPMQAHYTPTKSGQIALMASMAVALGPHNITCNSVSPGSIRTALNEHLLADPEIRARDEAAIPLRRLGEPSDVANAVAFLVSDDAAYITGSNIVVDGGALVWRP
jgi:NAD(P)-dependent dehydrogenase (short-subunit alcohol dehydrogenase family)